MKKFIREVGETNQLVPPGLQKSLISERAIQTFKARLIAGLSSCDPKSPLHLWDRLIQQAQLTLNLLRPDRMNPRLSAELYLNGDFYFNHAPLSPLVKRVIISDGPTK